MDEHEILIHMEAQLKDKSVKAVVTFSQDAASLRTAGQANQVIAPTETKSNPKEEGSAETNNLTELAEVAQKITVPVASVLSDREDHQDGSQDDGRIIRDTKRKRFRLIPAMMEASTSWFQKKQDALQTYRHPYHPVENADARKEVINAAVREGSIAPQEDFHVVSERLKEAPRTAVKTGITLKAKADIPAPQWSHVTDETDSSAVEDATPHVPTEQPELPVGIEVASQQTVPQTTLVVEVASETPVYKEPVEEIPTPAPTQSSATPEPVTKPVIPSVVLQTEEAVVSTPLPTVPREEVVPRDIAQPDQTVQSLSTKSSSSFSSVFARYVLIGVFVVAGIAGVGTSFILFRNTDEAPIEKKVTQEVPSLMNAPQYPYALPENRDALLQGLQQGLPQNVGVTQLYPTVLSQEGVAVPATAEQILATLAPKTSLGFNRATLQIVFGATQAEPFMVMKITNFDVAFAGMLAWEQTMSSDLSPLFGTPVVSTFDASARTSAQVRDAFFKDSIASNKNVRLLLDESGEDRIVYTFTDQNTILITTTREALATLLPLLQ